MGKRKLVKQDENNNEVENQTKKQKATITPIAPTTVLAEIDTNKPQTSASASVSENVSINTRKSAANKKDAKPEAPEISANESDNKDEAETEVTREENSKYMCRCSYSIETEATPNAEKCPINVALQNHVTYPPFKLLSSSESPSAVHFNLTKHIPNKHWVLLVEIDEYSANKLSCSLKGKTLFGEEVCVVFNPSDKSKAPTTFAWSNMKKGNTIAIMYAEKKTNDTVEVTNFDFCYVFNSKLKDLAMHASILLENADLKSRHESPVCFKCDLTINNNDSYEPLNKEPIYCPKCNLAVFCGQSCAKTYKEKQNHKELCPQFSTLLNLASLPRHKFTNNSRHFSFKTGEQPSYEYEDKFIQIYTFPTPYNKINRQCGLCYRNFRDCWIDKKCSLTKTDCCKKWICNDESARDMRSFSKDCKDQFSCYKSHRKYSMCNFHYAEGHRGRWNNCATCRSEQSDYDESNKEWFNFGVNPKPKRQWIYVKK
jgi:hypothetical protein